MVIEMNREITPDEAKEFTCVLMNASQLLAKPTKKLSNVFGFCVKMGIFVAFATLFFGFFVLKGDRDAYTLTGMIIAALCIFFLAVFAFKINQVYKTILKREADHVIITLDENGIDYTVINNKRFQVTWDNVSFVRVFKQAAYIFPKEITGVIFSLELNHLEELKSFFKEHSMDIEVIE
ncbi:MAG: hypothetical protein IKS85_05610 [Lachnospiraceae bacterium]|nr:hypothetical protein [Lachnospiraceae bacterium]